MSTQSGSSGVKRREFLKVLGATGAAAGAVGCSSERVERLIPYLNQPDQTVPGVSNYFATTCRECAAACGVVAETRDGRAITLEGNPEHPLNRGALCSKGMAGLQGLYNPDRYRQPMLREGDQLRPVTWERALQELTTRLGQLGPNAANAVFINQHESGSFPALLDRWLVARGMPPHISYDADLHVPAVAGHQEVYGVAWPSFQFEAARLVVSIGADFLDDWGAMVPQQLSWANARAQLENAPRFIYIGPRRSLTGLNADQWVPIRPGTDLEVTQALRAAIGGDESQLAGVAERAGVEPAILAAVAQELRAAGSRALVLAAGRGVDGTETVVAAAQLNQTLGSVGVTVRPDQPLAGFERVATYNEIRAVAERMAAGQVPVLFVRGANPVFTTPPSLGFAAAMVQVPFKVSFSLYPDETTALCDLVLPDHHALESWGSAQPTPGIVSLQQPAMNPVFETRSTGDLLIALDPTIANGAQDYRAYVFNDVGLTPGTAAAALQRGITPGSTSTGLAVPTVTPVPAPEVLLEQTEGEFYFYVYPHAYLGTGAGGNKPWLQELADPVTKIAWQSWIEIHPTTALRLGVEDGDHLTVTTAVGSVTAPAFVYLGVRPDTVAMALGRGHTVYGRYAQDIGINPLVAIPAVAERRSGALALAVTKAQVTRAAEHSPLVTTAGSARQHGRGIAQAVLVSELGDLAPVTVGESGPGVASVGGENEATGVAASPTPRPEPEGGHEIPGVPSFTPLPGLYSPLAADAQGELADSGAKDLGMYDPNHWSQMARRRWAMTIDLARCTGCQACVTACYMENNLPTVGAPWQGRATSPVTWDERPGANIIKGREMTWIRLERYFEGGEDYSANFEARFVPMLCQHCGNAPCEPVCPVYATYHSPDGLNVQVYNRCVGTRYCSNNCPYKVRYFNWFGYGEPDRRQYAWPEPLNWQLNPDVTVRGKGVMEKCTFCVQRIREAEHRASAEQRAVRPDEFTTACASACPSRAIVFGDAADREWAVSQQALDRRAYHVFADLSTFTAVVYLKKVIHASPLATPAT